MSILNTEAFSNLNTFEEKKEEEEQPIIKQPTHVPSYSSIMSDKTFNAGGLPTLPVNTPQRKMSLTELRKDPEFNNRAKRFLDGVGENDDIFEYLRDSEYSLTSAITRSFQVGKWTDEQKQDYNYLMNRFRNSKLKGFGERMEFAKDLAIDVIADPLNILSLLFVPATGGLSLGAKTAATKLAQQGVKKYMKKGGIYGAAEGAGWGGSYDYFNQSIDFGLGNNDGIDWGDVAKVSALGAGIGGAVGAGLTAGAYWGKTYRYSNEDAIIKQYDEWDTDGWSASTVRNKIADKEMTSDTFLRDSSEGGYNIIKHISQIMAEKPTTRFVQLAAESDTLKQLLRTFRYDWDVGFLNQGEKGVRKESYGLAVGRRQGNYLFRLKKALKNLDRTGWWAKLSSEDNGQLLAYLQNPNITEVNGKAIKPYIIDAGNQIKEILDDTFSDGQKVGLFEEFRKVVNYFPRKFARSVLETKEGRDNFEDLLVKYNHANPINDRETAKKVAVETGQEVEVYVKDLTTDEEIFGVNFLVEANGNEQVAKRLKAKAIVDNMLEYKFNNYAITGQQSVGGGGASFLRHRLFTNIPDEELRPFIDNDVQNVLEDYFVNAASLIERSDKFGGNLFKYREKFTNKIAAELQDKGMSEADALRLQEKLDDMYLKVTGQNRESSGILTGTRFRSQAGQTASEWGRLSQQMAHLPFATLSSITEPLILISRAGLKDSPKVFADITTALTKEMIKTVNKAARASYRFTTGKTTKGLADVDDEAWGEIYKTGLAMEQAVLERIEGLTGEAMRGSTAKGLSNAFFQANLLQQWTSAVQLASFTTAKRMMRDISKRLYDDSTGVSKLGKRKKDYFIKQLNELGVDENDAQNWYRLSLKDGKFDVALSQKQDFYNQTYLPAANRFTKEVILNPSTAEANRPLWFSSPAGQLLVQFAGYPTVFNNTILKKFAQFYRNPVLATPKILGASMLMTGVAVAGNYIRSNGRNLERYDLDEPQDQFYLALDGIQRWGGLGMFDYVRRWYENYRVGGGQLGIALKTPTGPLTQDVVDMILYRKGFGEMAASNLPFYGIYDLPKYIDEDLPFGRREVRQAGREVDKFFKDSLEGILGEERFARATGGLVEGPKVPNTIEDPADRINPETGEPYVEGTLLDDRVPFQDGGRPEDNRPFADKILEAIKLNENENINNFRRFMEATKNVESDNNYEAIQFGTPIARGAYQYETNLKFKDSKGNEKQGSNAAFAAVNRLVRMFSGDKPDYITTITVNEKDRKEIFDRARKLQDLGKRDGLIDLSKESKSFQDALFVADKIFHPNLKVKDLLSGKLSIEDAWLNYHWAGSSDEKETKRNLFRTKNK